MIKMVKHTDTDSTSVLVNDLNAQVSYHMAGYIPVIGSMLNNKPTPIPCTPIHIHDVVDCDYINHVVDLGFTTITLSWVAV